MSDNDHELECQYQYDPESGDLIMPDFSISNTDFDQKNFPSPSYPTEIHAKFLIYHVIRSLPLDYQSLDPQRLIALHFAVVGIDLLGQSKIINDKIKGELIEFIYSLQLPENGFAGSPILKTTSTTTHGHVAATYSAISLLKTLGDDLSRVNIDSIVSLLNKCIVKIPTNPLQPSIVASNVALQTLQSSIVTMPLCKKSCTSCSCAMLCPSNTTQTTHLGPFYASTTHDDFDVRFLFCAMALCENFDLWQRIDMQPLNILKYCVACQTYEGGCSLTDMGQEAHGGATHTTLMSYYLLLNYIVKQMEINPNQTHQWLLSNGQEKIILSSNTSTIPSSQFTPLLTLPQFNFTRLEKWIISLQGDGYRGRTNKVRDCCYTYWLGSLAHLLDLSPLSHPFGNAYFVSLCENTTRGGFGRDEDRVSEILHTFYAIAGLSILKELHTNEYQDKSKVQLDPTIASKSPEDMSEDEKDAMKSYIIKTSWTRLERIDPVLGISYRASKLTPQNRPTFQQLLNRYQVAGNKL